MNQPLFDFDLKRVSRTHYITGKAAINFPDPGSTTGGWHFLVCVRPSHLPNPATLGHGVHLI